MTTTTLKKLIENFIDNQYAENEFKDELKTNILFFINLYESEELPKETPSKSFEIIGVPNGVLCLPDKVPYSTICSCNPNNGGSGICGCTMANQMVDNPIKYKTTDLPTSNIIIN